MKPSERIEEINDKLREEHGIFAPPDLYSHAISIYLDEEWEKKVRHEQYLEEKHKCCNAWCVSNSEVILAPDPFQSEIHGNNNLVWKCEDCRKESYMSI